MSSENYSEESILIDMRESLVGPDEKGFDKDLLMLMPGIFLVLQQNGIGPEEQFRVTGEEEKWSDFTIDSKELDAVRTYLWMKLRYIFDPPKTSFTQQALKEEIKEIEWRLGIQ